MAEVRAEFRCSLNLGKGSFRRAKFVLENNRDLQEPQTVAGEDLIVDIRGRQDNLANLRMHPEDKVVGIEFGTTEDRVLSRMIPRIGGKTDFTSGDYSGTTGLRIRFEYGELTIHSEFEAVNGRQRSKPVRGIADVNSKSPSLTIGWDYSHENQTNAHEQRFAALHPCVSSGK